MNSNPVLIIDDDRKIRNLLKNFLNFNQMSAREVGSIHEAKQMLDKISAPPCIFLDNTLPDGYGIQFMVNIFLRNLQ